MSETSSAYKHGHGSRHVHYVDHEGHQHDALITGTESPTHMKLPINLVFVNSGGTECRATSVPHRDAMTSHLHSYHFTNETHHHRFVATAMETLAEQEA